MTGESVIRIEDLSESMRGMLLVVRWADRPGHCAPARNGTLRALERRGLVASRADPVDPRSSLWTATATGCMLLASEALR